ncbi:MAG: hypothetical protein ACXABY_08720, partial [Candidatus Thorarchaeota archaeon]
HPLINSVEVEGAEALVVYTGEIVIDGDTSITSKQQDILNHWAGKIVPIGKFRINLQPGGRVDIKNLTNAKGKWQHPHVPTSGACLGSIESTLPKMLSAYEFGSAAQLVIAYLECCDADDGWGKNIYMWDDDALSKEEVEAAASAA